MTRTDIAEPYIKEQTHTLSTSTYPVDSPSDNSEQMHLLTDMELELRKTNDTLLRTHTRLSEIEATYNNFVFKKKNKRNGAHLNKIREEEEARLQITALMERQTLQSKRLEIFKLLYSYANVYNYNSVLSSHLRQILFPGNPSLQRKRTVKAATRELANALHRYCLDGPSDEADEDVRSAVHSVERCYEGPTECLIC